MSGQVFRWAVHQAAAEWVSRVPDTTETLTSLAHADRVDVEARGQGVYTAGGGSGDTGGGRRGTAGGHRRAAGRRGGDESGEDEGGEEHFAKLVDESTEKELVYGEGRWMERVREKRTGEERRRGEKRREREEEKGEGERRTVDSLKQEGATGKLVGALRT